MPKRAASPFVLATVLIDALGFGIVMPVLPRLLMEVGNFGLAEALNYAVLIGFATAAAAFLSAPLIGDLSDRFGRRPILLFSLAGLAADYVLLSLANTLWGLLVARLFSGIFGSSYTAAQAAVADVTAPEDRARQFGLVSAAIGLGLVAGPLTGGILGGVGTRAPFIAAAALAAVNLLIGVVAFRETLPPDRRRAFTWRSFDPRANFRAMAAIPQMPRLFAVFLLWEISSLVYPTTWSFYTIAQLGWNSLQTGASLALLGVVVTISQVTLVGPAVAKFGERKSAAVGLAIAVVIYSAFAFCSSGWVALLLILALSLQAPVQPSLTALISRAAPADRQGAAQAMVGMAAGLGQLAAPLLLFGAMARFADATSSFHFPGAAFLVAAVLGCGAWALLSQMPRSQPPPGAPNDFRG